MKRYRVILWMLLISLLAGICTGCGETVQTVTTENAHVGAVSVANMESTPVINYIVPQTTPNILVNQAGYATTADKEVVLKGSVLPEQFALIDVETEAEVFNGEIEQVIYNEETKLYTGLAVFTDFAQEGTFYLECDTIGRSLTFSIENDIYQKLFSDMYQEIITSCRERTAAVSDVTVLMTAYEWYPEMFPDEDKNEIPDVMEAVADWIQNIEQTESDDSHETLYVAALAKFSYLYQKFDLQYATECLQHASVIFSKKQLPSGRDADYFYALTELYRATGLYTYRTQIQDYVSFFEGNTSYLGESSYLYGAMTYLVTRQKVNVDLCNTFMVDIMDRGEEVSKRYEDMIAPLTAKNNGADDLLTRAKELSCCNYVLNNYQYTHVIREILHYLMGRNLESVSFYPDEGAKSGYLLLLTQLAATSVE